MSSEIKPDNLVLSNEKEAINSETVLTTILSPAKSHTIHILMNHASELHSMAP